MKRRYLVVGGAALVIAGSVGAALPLALSRSDTETRDTETRDFRGSTPHSVITLPEFALRDHRGELVQSDALRGRVVVVTFLETKCNEACPFIAGTLGTAFRRMSPAERKGVVALAVSTHPRDDTPSTARAFLRRERAERFVRYLVGSEADLRPVWRAFQILPALDSGDADLHSAPVRVYDRESRWVSTLHAGIDLTPGNVIHDVTLAKRS